MVITLIARTVIAKATRGYDREYDYLVPEQLTERAKPGSRALVPFGKKNTLRHAIILSVFNDAAHMDSCPDIDANNLKNTSGALKWLADIPDAAPALMQKDIDLAAKMREKYYCTWFDALSCMLPAGWERQKKSGSKRLRAGDPAGETDNPAPDGDTAMESNNPAPGGDPTETSDSFAPGGNPAGETDNPAPEGDEATARGRFELTAEQKSALSGLIQTLERREYAEALLYGVTGSGKTEIYMRLIDRIVAQGRQAIALVPEISLTPQMMQRFIDFFGDRVAIFHSRLTESVRKKQWRRVRDGEVQIALGARSAVFAPFSNLGAIIIDEEHEPSYKSEMTPRYHTRDIAKMRCESHGALLLSGSATPAVELYYRATRGECGLFVLRERTNRKPLPKVYIADMRDELKSGNRAIFSRGLSKAISDELSERKQVILFLNRRGYSSFLLCRSCGYIVSCRDCSVSYTYHMENDRLICHYCGLTAPVPRRCPLCGGAEIGAFGAGTERVESEARRLFPHSRILRMDRDTTVGKDNYAKILNAFRDGEADILIGTQMIAKGHDFPNVTLVGVLAADTILNFSDYRATERTFQLLTQVAGRSGRGEASGRVVIQTYNPDHFSIAAAKEHDYLRFYKQEMIARRELRYPPFMNIGVFLLTGRDDGRVGEAAAGLKRVLEPEGAEGLDILGPARPAHAKIKERYRWRVIIKHKDIDTMETVARRAADTFYGQKKSAGVDLAFDINPFSML